MVIMLVENGKPYWFCQECDQAYFDHNEVAYGHDCEA
jgi:YHS domain-containing protein